MLFRSTADDLGRGGKTPFVNPMTGQNFPLSFSALAKLQAQGLLPFQTPILNPIIPLNIPVNANGSFKTPGLRNIELTTPYFHNGSVMEIADVIDFYSRAGNFHQENLHDLDPVIGGGLFLIQGRHDLHIALDSFLRALTDHRVLEKAAPFDHPEILIPEGYPEVLLRIPATNYEGLPAPASVLSLNAVFTPTGLSSQVISGTVEAGLTPAVAVNTAAVAGPVTVDGIVWSAEITGMELGDNVVTISVLDGDSILTTVTQTIVYVDTRPVIVSEPVTNAAAGELYMYAIQAVDPSGDVDGYELVEGPEGMFIFPDWGLVLWLPTSAQGGAHPVTVRVADLAGFDAVQSFTVTVASSGGGGGGGAGAYEAEAAVLGGGTIVSTAVSGYTGTGFVDYVAASGEFIEWTVPAPGAGAYKLEFRYALNGANRPLRISVNGTVVNPSFAFPSTGGWTTWGTVSMTATLNAGSIWRPRQSTRSRWARAGPSSSA